MINISHMLPGLKTKQKPLESQGGIIVIVST